MAITRIRNNQVTDAVSGNVYSGINAAVKLQDYTITAGKLGNSIVYGSDLTISGNLTVNGTSTTVDTVSVIIEDPILLLAKDQTSTPAVDIGFIGERGSSQNIAFVWDESDGKFATAFTNDTTTNTTITVASYASFKTLDAAVTGALTVTGATGLTGNLTLTNASATGLISVTGNVTGGNLITAGLGSIGTTLGVTGNITGGNLITAGLASVTGNVTGGNLITAGLGSIGTTLGVTGNITGGNLITAGLASVTGNVTGGNLTTTGKANIGTMEVTGVGTIATLSVTGDALVAGNLTVQGNLTYINVDELRVEDPIIQLGGGANGAALTTNDNKDRGALLTYFSTATGNAFMGWDNSTGYMIAASNVSVANDVITVNSFGTFQAGTVTATTATISGNVTGGNLITAGLGSIGTTLTVTGNITGGNLITAGLASVTGNVTGGNLVTAGLASVTGNVTGGNLITTGKANIGNIRFNGDDITGTNGRVDHNSALGDVDFSFSGTAANVFYIDAGASTASFGNATQTTNVLASFNSTTSILAPRGTTGQRPGTGVAGMVRFNTTTGKLEFHDGAEWVIAGTTFTVVQSQTFSGDGSTTAFTINSGYTTAACIVSINGILQIPVTAYAVAGTTLTFTEAPQTGDAIEVREVTTTQTVKSISNTTGNAVVEVTDPINAVYITGNLHPVGNVTYSLGNATARWKDLFLSGSSMTLGNVVIKNTTGNTISFYGPDGSTAATIDSNNIDTTLIASGTSSVAVIASGGNVRTNVGGSTISTASSTGIAVTGLLSATTTITATGNVTGGNLVTAGLASVTGNITGGNLITAGLGSIGTTLAVTGNANVGNLGTAGLIVATGNITGGNLSGTAIVGTLTTAAQTNITSLGTLSSLAVSANITGGNLTTAGIITVNSGGAATAIVNGGSNGVGNIGSSTTYFNTAFVKATSAQYADLAEMYEADAEYEPGTVLCFGGAKEVTLCTEVDCTKVAGVVSTNPSYLMNSGQNGDHVSAVALQGRVPTKVTGQVFKGDLMVSAGDGCAQANNAARAGTIIGKALADFHGQDGIIEIVVGRV